MVVSGKMDNKLDVYMSEAEMKNKEERTEQESIRESDSTILDASSDSPRGLLINCRNLYSKGGGKDVKCHSTGCAPVSVSATNIY